MKFNSDEVWLDLGGKKEKESLLSKHTDKFIHDLA